MPPKVHIENGIFRNIPHLVKGCGSEFAVVTDANLKARGEELVKFMRSAGHRCHLIVLAPREETKSLKVIEKMAGMLLKLGMRRDGCLLALGGGVVGDVTGFLASIYLRGIAYIGIPTTLLAMADSSIGGKTGVNMDEGKNLLGTFYYPLMVISDPLLLKDLPERVFRSGLAEVVKHAVVADRSFFDFLDKHASATLTRTPNVLKSIIEKSVKIKLSIVSRDERESLRKAKKGAASRMLLNYGHTVGHVLESLSRYRLLHGEAIAIGIVAENRIAVAKAMLNEKDAEKIRALLLKFHLPTKTPPDISEEQLKKALTADKKHIDGALYAALPVKIGRARVALL